MDYNIIKQLIQDISESNLTSFAYKDKDVDITLEKNNVIQVAKEIVTKEPVSVVEKETKVEESATIISANDKKTGCKIVTSPMVGTFYAAGSPDKPPMVKVGDKVKKGQVVCIVEAMKLMNEIESTEDGVVEEILVDNEDMVEFGQPIFRLV